MEKKQKSGRDAALLYVDLDMENNKALQANTSSAYIGRRWKDQQYEKSICIILQPRSCCFVE